MGNEIETTTVKISANAKKLLDEIAKERGINRIELISRTVEWISRQDKTLQAIILDQISKDDAPSVLGLIQKRLGQELTDKHLDIDSTLSEASGRAKKRKKKE